MVFVLSSTSANAESFLFLQCDIQGDRSIDILFDDESFTWHEGGYHAPAYVHAQTWGGGMISVYADTPDWGPATLYVFSARRASVQTLSGNQIGDIIISAPQDGAAAISYTSVSQEGVLYSFSDHGRCTEYPN